MMSFVHNTQNSISRSNITQRFLAHTAPSRPKEKYKYILKDRARSTCFVPTMTTRNLNQTWRDVVFTQYAADYEADVPFPVTYLINVPEWKQDILIKIPEKIDLKTLRKSVLDFCRAAQGADPVYDGEHISVKPRKPASALPKETESRSEQNDVPP